MLIDVFHPVKVAALVAVNNGLHFARSRAIGPTDRYAAVAGFPDREFHFRECLAQRRAHVLRRELPAIDVIALGQVCHLRRRLQPFDLSGESLHSLRLVALLLDPGFFSVLQQTGNFCLVGLVVVDGPLNAAHDRF
ncbi:hypothetical protein D9M70_543650 [compost metagenome]